MAWQAITEGDVQTSLSGPEMQALENEHLDDGQTEVVRSTIRQVAGMVRGFVAANESNDLAADDQKVPVALVPAALSLIRWRLISRLPGMDLISDTRRQDYEDAMAMLRDVGAGRISIDTSAEDRTHRSPIKWGSCTQLEGLG